jgi:hypothetical protein
MWGAQIYALVLFLLLVLVLHLLALFLQHLLMWLLLLLLACSGFPSETKSHLEGQDTIVQEYAPPLPLLTPHRFRTRVVRVFEASVAIFRTR